MKRLPTTRMLVSRKHMITTTNSNDNNNLSI